MVSFLQKIFLVGLFFCSNRAVAQLKFTASVSANEISKNEFVQFKLSVENAAQVQQINQPAFKNFTVVSGPNEETGMTMINGNVKKYTALNFILKPNTTGKFTIPSTTAKADGKELQSNVVIIKVNNTTAPNNANGNGFVSPFSGIDPFANPAPENVFSDNILKKGENVTDKINKNIFIKLDVDKTSCYVGQPIIATYKLYTRLKSESNLSKSPSFNGFSVIDLMQSDYGNYKRENYNGKDYNVYIIRKSQLYPLQSGNLELEPAEIENDITFIKEDYAKKQNSVSDELIREFEDAKNPTEGMVKQKITLQSKPTFINVKPLPISNVPVSFTGAVGNFTIEATAEKNNFTTDETGKIKLQISGQGNLQLVNAPEIQWPQGFEAFEPTIFDNVNKTTVPVSGEKIFNYSFSIAQPSNYVLPAIKFSYFNAKEGKYITDSTKPFSFTVTKGILKNVTALNDSNTDNNKLLNKFFSNRLRVISLVAVLILSGLIFWLKLDKKKEQKQIAINNNAIASDLQPTEEKINEVIVPEEKNWLEKATELLPGDSTAFYNELNFALKNFLSKKLNLPIETINKKNITEELDKKNISVSTSIHLQQLMNQIELQLYAPFAEKEKMQELFNSTDETIRILDTYKI